MYHGQNDETLVMLTLAGEQAAYEALVARYEKAAVASAASVTHNLHLAEDSAQDAFITAWIKLNMLRDPSKYGAWVCRIAKNCAKNTVMRFRSFISLEDAENVIASDAEQGSPQNTCELSEENTMLHESIERLPERVRRIIRLHYFEDLSVNEIAEKMGISAGTVKWQLHEGRKRIRKELCAMNEEYNDTLVQRVMKKVEELKQWQYKNSKNGFERVYKETLKEVGELPESMDKYHALADVLMRGWWWIAGDKNDALFQRIQEAAEKGGNDEVMEFVTLKEDDKLYGDTKIEFILNTQIPRLEKSGFKKALAAQWNMLGEIYFGEKQPDKGFEAYEKLLSVAEPSNLYYSYAKGVIEAEKMCAEKFKDTDPNKYHITANALEYRITEGTLRLWYNKWYNKGYLFSDNVMGNTLYYATACDGMFTAKGLNVGERYIGSDGSTLEYTSGSVFVTTPCGDFDSCQLWTVGCHDQRVIKTYYKEGVGIVKSESRYNGFTETRLLCGYDIKGGSGPIPLHKGNRWEYTAGFDPEFKKQKTYFTVEYCDGKTAMMYGVDSMERVKYDDNSWVDMITQIRNEYCRVSPNFIDQELVDVSYPIKRARELAKTPVEKAHTRAACSVMERIFATDPRFNLNYTETGHWNFFNRDVVNRESGKIFITDDFRWSFEWKNITNGNESHPIKSILYNDIYSILNDGTGCIWNDKWVDGYKETITAEPWYQNYCKTDICCENAGTVKTKAGIFDNCIKLSLDIGDYGEYVRYRSGKKDYYFAPKIGIVKVVNYSRMFQCVFELAEYEGEGEGYMPAADGMIRKYEAVGLTDGYRAGAEYIYAADEDGQLYIFEDRSGVRKKPEIITDYGVAAGEVLEEELWRQDKHGESRLRHDINNFNLLVHSVSRPNRCWCAPEKRTAQSKLHMKIYETLGEGGEVPRAWLGHYAYSCFLAACSLMGSGNTEEGYEYLDRSFDLFQKWYDIPGNTLLETGNELILGGIKVVMGENLIQLPDGTREPIIMNNLNIFEYSTGFMYYAMTAPHGWEWFNGVRDEERFKRAVERAKSWLDN
ncbi:MAG: sigma-70 family RNA polymerase sigma factor [Bacteroides sp.]|nr:sigma-70 family RNA polymerase sigma factor [Bacteroides sp.]